MSLQSHITALTARHQELKKTIYDAQRHYLDDMIVQKLKREKLALKEELRLTVSKMQQGEPA